MGFLSISGIILWVLVVLYITFRIIYGKNWTFKAGTSFFVGKGLIKATKNLIGEVKQRTIKDETVAEVGVHVLWRLTRIGILGLVVALAPTWLLFNQNGLLSKQNEKIDFQNNLFSKQNEKIDIQNKSINIQNNLIEAERRSSLVFLMSNILDKVDEEIKEQKKDNPKKKKFSLSEPLIGRIIALSHSFKPYKQLTKGDSLSSKSLSPERGQLLIALSNSNLSSLTQKKINTKGNFTKADLTGANFIETNFSGANFTEANFNGASFIESDLNGTNLSGTSLVETDFTEASLVKADFTGANLNHAIFWGANLTRANLTRTNLTQANLGEANLRGANLTNANLTKTSLRRADLRNTVLIDATFKETILWKADLRNAFHQIIFSETCSIAGCKGIPEKTLNKLKKDSPCLFSKLGCCTQ